MTNSYFTPQRIAVAAVAVACAASRFAATAPAVWEWDEALFSTAMRSYDVAVHHPHPPGYPAYIALAKSIRWLASSDFRALQAINLLAGMLLFPAIYVLAREIGLRFDTSLIGAALCSFLPNVWIFGGTAFSDVPSLTAAVFAAALLMRGARDRNAYWIGTALLALAIAIRPQTILIGLYPGIRASMRRRRRDVAIAALIGIVITAVAYGAAMKVTGVHPYLDAVREHGAYIARNDSFRNPERPSLLSMFERFFLTQYGSKALSAVMSLLVLVAAIGAVRDRWRPAARLVLTFAPVAIFSWLMLDRFSTSRYSIAYAPMFALLAAEGVGRVARRYELVAGAVLTAAFIVWTWPALAVVRTVSPPVLAVRAAERMAPQTLYVATAMIPFVEDLAPDLRYAAVIDERALALGGEATPWLLAEIDRTLPRGGYVYRRDRDRLWNVVRRRYFAAALEPMSKPRFGAGWSASEPRCMHGRAVIVLPASAGRTQLRIVLSATAARSVAVSLNGAVIDRFSGAEADRSYEVTPAAGPNALGLAVDGGDLCLRNLSWGRDVP